MLTLPLLVFKVHRSSHYKLHPMPTRSKLNLLNKLMYLPTNLSNGDSYDPASRLRSWHMPSLPQHLPHVFFASFCYFLLELQAAGYLAAGQELQVRCRVCTQSGYWRMLGRCYLPYIVSHLLWYWKRERVRYVQARSSIDG